MAGRQRRTRTVAGGVIAGKADSQWTRNHELNHCTTHFNVSWRTVARTPASYFSRQPNRFTDVQVFNQPIIVLDFETTGLRADRGDRVIEIAALRLEGSDVVARCETVVNCGRRVPRHIQQFTGITQQMVDGGAAPMPAFTGLLQFIANTPVIAHNAAFDQGFLECESARLGLRHSGNDFICTVQLARALFPEFRSHALGALSSHFRLPYIKAHRAAGDAQATLNLLLHLSDVIRERYATDVVDTTTLRHVIDAPALRGPSVANAAITWAA